MRERYIERKERETEQESYMQIELHQVYQNSVMSYFVAQLKGARSMHILNYDTKKCM